MDKLKWFLSKVGYVIGLVFVIALFVIAILLLRSPDKSYPASPYNSYPPPSEPTPTFTTVPYPPPGNPQNLKNIFDQPPQDPNSLRITPTVPAFASDGWYIYTDIEVGYSFHYPKESHLTSGKGPRYTYNAIELEYFVPNEISYHGISISVEPNPTNISPTTYAANIYSQLIPNGKIPSNFTGQDSSIIVGNATALKTIIPPTLSEFTLLIPYKDKMIIISPVRDPMINDDPVKAEASEIFNKILMTFKFIQ